MIIILLLICIILYSHIKKYNKFFQQVWKKKIPITNNEDIILKTLNHKNIVKIINVKKTKNFKILYLKDDGMLPIGDFNPNTFINNNPKLKSSYEHKIKKIAKQLLDTIKYIHLKNIIHNDIHPYNILYNPLNDKIVIIDFSEAIIGSKSISYIMGGECYLYYMPPEKIIKQKSKYYITNKVDIYTIGSIVYVLLTGQTLYSHIRPSKIIETIQNNLEDNGINNYLLSNYSSNCIDLLRKLLEKNPIKRISASEALKHNWFKTS